METRANYILIGAFTLAGLIGLLGFVLWFARIEVARQFAYYDIDFPSVSGLSNASAVRFAGYPVGQVVDMSLAQDGDGRIRVRIEVAADTPIRTGTVATVESQGVTGVGFVGLSPGEPEQPLLRQVSDEEVPSIPAGRSVLQVLSEDAPQIVEEALEVARQVRAILGEVNQARIGTILANLETSSADLGQAMDDFSEVTDTIATATEEIAAFTERLDTISAGAATALETADRTLQDFAGLAERAEVSLDVGDRALESGRRVFESAETFVVERLPPLLDDLTETTAHLRGQVDLLTDDARAVLQEFRATGTLATERLDEAEATIVATDEMLARLTETLSSVEGASQSLQSLVDGDGAALVADLRGIAQRADTLIASATTIAEDDLPAIVADIRTASEAASRAVTEVSGDLSEAAGRIDGLSASAEAAFVSATETFTAANTTIERLNAAIETGDKALAAADRAFTSTDEVMRDDVAAITANLRETLGKLDGAIDRVSTDLPEITANLRDTAERANAAFGQFEFAVTTAAGPVETFAREGLPQYSRLARETRTLISTLEQLVRNIERDPARYFLGRDEPVYRR